MDKKKQAEQVIKELTGMDSASSPNKVSRPGSGRPGGNPEFGKKIGFKTEGDSEPNNVKISLWVKKSTLEKVKLIDNWQKIVRNFLDELVEDSNGEKN